MITYPHNPPAEPGPIRVTMRAHKVAAMNTSPFTFGQEVFAWDGERWALDAALPPMREAEAEAWIAWRLALRGVVGTFHFGDPMRAAPRGTVTGSPVVDGGGQTGATLATRGWDGELLAGDNIQIGSGSSARLYKVLADAATDSDGEAALEIFPRLREGPADGAPIVTSNPVGLFRMADNDWSWDHEGAGIYGLSFRAVEAL